MYAHPIPNILKTMRHQNIKSSGYGHNYCPPKGQKFESDNKEFRQWRGANSHDCKTMEKIQVSRPQKCDWRITSSNYGQVSKPKAQKLSCNMKTMEKLQESRIPKLDWSYNYFQVSGQISSQGSKIPKFNWKDTRCSYGQSQLLRWDTLLSLNEGLVEEQPIHLPTEEEELILPLLDMDKVEDWDFDMDEQDQSLDLDSFSDEDEDEAEDEYNPSLTLPVPLFSDDEEEDTPFAEGSNHSSSDEEDDRSCLDGLRLSFADCLHLTFIEEILFSDEEDDVSTISEDGSESSYYTALSDLSDWSDEDYFSALSDMSDSDED